MRKLFSILCVLGIAFSGFLHAQDYPQIVTLESVNGTNAVFLSAGVGNDKNASKDNAVLSLFYTLLFKGVDGVNDGQPVACENNAYTTTFFDINSRYKPYLVEKNDYVKPSKTGNMYHCTMRVTIRLNQLVRDVKKNTNCDGKAEAVKKTQPKPTIIVVPYKKDGESYKQILENDFDRRTAVEEVKKGFNDKDIRTIDLMSHIEQAIRRGSYEENAGAAESNDKALLTQSNADVCVIVDLNKVTSSAGNKVELRLHAHDVASNADWGSQTGGSKNYYRSATMAQLCRYAVNDVIDPFLKQIIKYYSEPTRVSLHVSLAGDSGNMLTSLQDPVCSGGEDSVADFIMYWLDKNAHDGDYHMQGVVDEEVIFDYVLIPKTDSKGRKMNPNKFLSMLKKALKDEGITCTTRLDGGTMILTVSQ